MDKTLRRVVSYIRHRWNQRVHLIREDGIRLHALLALLAPHAARAPQKIRVGTSRDGGYVMLDDFVGIDLALSLGIGPDVSWDYDLAERGISVWQFDHSIRTLPREHPRFLFEQKRIVGQNPGPDEVTLTSLFQKSVGKQLILKMDIEGGEWPVLSQLDAELLDNCRQIVIEFHQFMYIQNPAWRDAAEKALVMLTEKFGVVHVHGNNLSKHIVTHDRVLPDSLEVTFANRRFYNLAPTDETFPGPYDRTNNPYFPDFALGRFRFPYEQEWPE